MELRAVLTDNIDGRSPFTLAAAQRDQNQHLKSKNENHSMFHIKKDCRDPSAGLYLRLSAFLGGFPLILRRVA